MIDTFQGSAPVFRRTPCIPSSWPGTPCRVEGLGLALVTACLHLQTTSYLVQEGHELSLQIPEPQMPECRAWLMERQMEKNMGTGSI